MTDRAAALVEVLGGDVAVVAVALRKATRQARLEYRPLGARLERLIADVAAAVAAELAVWALLNEPAGPIVLEGPLMA